MSSVYQRLMSDGAWEITLKEETPRAILNLLRPFNIHIVITPSELDVGESDAVFLAASRYVGPLRRIGRNRLQPGGPGNAMWLSDPDGKGEIIESAISAATPNLSNWVNALLPTSITAGTVTSPGGTFSNTYLYVSRRDAINSVCRAFGVEWRVNNDWTFDAGTVNNLYRSVADGDTPAAIVARSFGGRDPQVVGIRSDIDVSVDWDDYINDVIVLGKEVGDAAGGGSFLKPTGVAIDWQRVVVDPTAPVGAASGIALSLFHQLQTKVAGHREVKVSTDLFDVAGDVTLGDDVWVYDPENGLLDTANQVTYQGQLLPALAMRCVGIRWPVRRGMGVYLRVSNGTAPYDPTYYNITPYVEFEDGAAELELGEASRGLTSDSAGNLVASTGAVVNTPWLAYTPTLTGATSNPSLGTGGTVTGSYRREGTTLYFRGKVTFGTGGGGGSGGYRVSLPSGVTAVSGHDQIIKGRGYDSSAGLTAELTPLTGATDGVALDRLVLAYVATPPTLALVTSTAPYTWASGDTIQWNGTLEVVP